MVDCLIFWDSSSCGFFFFGVYELGYRFAVVKLESFIFGAFSEQRTEVGDECISNVGPFIVVAVVVPLFCLFVEIRRQATCTACIIPADFIRESFETCHPFFRIAGSGWVFVVVDVHLHELIVESNIEVSNQGFLNCTVCSSSV